MPWLLAAADALIVDESRRARTLAFAAIAVILASELLLGFPQGVWWNMMTLAAFAVFRAGETRLWSRLLPCWRPSRSVSCWAGSSCCRSADAAAHSTRMQLSREFALTFSMHPFNLFQFWSPYLFERGAYSDGELYRVPRVRHLLRRHPAGLADAGCGAGVTPCLSDAPSSRVLLCLPRWPWSSRSGVYGGVTALLSYLPVLQSLRAPARYIVLVQFALAILAAMTIDDLLAIAGQTLRRRRRSDARPVDSRGAWHFHHGGPELGTARLWQRDVRERGCGGSRSRSWWSPSRCSCSSLDAACAWRSKRWSF